MIYLLSFVSKQWNPNSASPLVVWCANLVSFGLCHTHDTFANVRLWPSLTHNQKSFKYILWIFTATFRSTGGTDVHFEGIVHFVCFEICQISKFMGFVRMQKILPHFRGNMTGSCRFLCTFFLNFYRFFCTWPFWGIAHSVTALNFVVQSGKTQGSDTQTKQTLVSSGP